MIAWWKKLQDPAIMFDINQLLRLNISPKNAIPYLQKKWFGVQEEIKQAYLELSA